MLIFLYLLYYIITHLFRSSTTYYYCFAVDEGREASIHPLPGLKADAHPEAVAGRQHAHLHALRSHTSAHAQVK